jgi:hypothetical protein
MRYSRNAGNFLFSGKSALDLAREYALSALAEVDSYDENTILSVPVDDLMQRLIEKYSFIFPELKEEDIYVEEREERFQQAIMSFDIYNDGGARFRETTRNVVVFHVPFVGAPEMFDIAPSARSVPGPAADMDRTELFIKILTDGKSSEQIQSELRVQLVEIRKHIDQMKRDLSNVRAHFEAPARQKIEERRAKLLKSKNLVASLGFPMKRRQDAPTTYVAPQIRRTTTPQRASTSSPFRPEPTLDEAEYQNILSIMDNMTKVMERSPHVFVKMGEEDIRQHFLVQLNGQYEGQATGETFNAYGKTDILIRADGNNIFIAECKFWHGEKGFLETVDQLLSYTTWRDTKTAIVIFNRNKNLSGVLSAIRTAMEKHPRKKRGPKSEGETRTRYIMGSPSDENREIIITVMVYDIPLSS